MRRQCLALYNSLLTCPVDRAQITEPRKQAWTSAHVLASIIVGFVFLVGFGLHQFYYNKEGLFNHQLFASRNFPIALVAIFVEGKCPGHVL